MYMIIIGLIVDILCCIVTGLSGMVCWNWFVPEIVASAPQMTFATAVGLAIVCEVFVSKGERHSLEDMNKDKIKHTFWNKVYSSMMRGVGKPLSMLLVGWIIHSMLF